MPVWVKVCLIVVALLCLLYVPVSVKNIKDSEMPVWVGIVARLFVPLTLILMVAVYSW